jgi:hypothetical protein
MAGSVELYDGLVAWLGLHAPTSAWFIAEGNGLVPALFDGTGEVVSTFGFFDKAGRPRVDRLRIRAYPIDSPYDRRTGEIVRERPCTRLVLDWPT